MSDINFCCPVCDVSLSADESEAGTMICCPGCSSDIGVPHQSGSTEDSTGPYVARLAPEQIPVCSTGIHSPHTVRGMVCFSLGTRGGMATQFETLKQVYTQRIAAKRKQGQISSGTGVGQFIGGIGIDADGDIGFAGQFAGASFRSDDIEIAFAIAVSGLQYRAYALGANAIVGFRWDVDFDSNANVANFFGTAYGTAVQVITNG